MSWQRVINYIDEMCSLAVPPTPHALRWRAMSYANKLMIDDISAPNVVAVTSEHVELRWKFPERDVVCRLAAKGESRWKVLIEQCIVTWWPVEE